MRIAAMAVFAGIADIAAIAAVTAAVPQSVANDDSDLIPSRKNIPPLKISI